MALQSTPPPPPSHNQSEAPPPPTPSDADPDLLCLIPGFRFPSNQRHCCRRLIHQLPVLTCCPSSSLCRLASCGPQVVLPAEDHPVGSRCAVRRCVAMRCQWASRQPLVASRAPQCRSDSLHLAVPVTWSQLRGRLVVVSSRSSFRRTVQPLPHSTRLMMRLAVC